MKLHILKLTIDRAFKPVSHKVAYSQCKGDYITHQLYINKLPYQITLPKSTDLDYEDSYEIIGGKFIPFRNYYSTNKQKIKKIYLQHIKSNE